MRIALVSAYDFAAHGGVKQHIEHLSREYRRVGHEVDVVAPLSGMTDDIEIDGFHGVGGVVPLHVNGSVARLSFSLNLRSRIKNLLTRKHFDIIHCHEPLMPVLPLVVLNYSRSVNIGTFHAYSETNFQYYYWRPVLQRFFTRLDGLVAVSEPAREYASQYFEGEYRIIPNGVDVSAFTTPAPPIAELMDGRTNILFLGRFEEERKGFKYLLKALPWVKQAHPDIRLVVLGHGDPAKFRSRMRRYGIARNVHYVGAVSDADRVRYMRSCQFLVAPSVQGESQGLVLLEAMAAGLPVIAGDIPGYASIVTNECEGLLVTPESEHALAIAMVHLLADGEKRSRMGFNGATKAQEHSWPKVASSLLELYTETQERKVWQSRDGGRGQRRASTRKAGRA